MMSMKAYKVSGTFLMKAQQKARHQRFTKEVAAENPGRAKEIVLSDLGSKHGTRRKSIKVTKIEEIPTEQVESSVVRYKIEGSR